MKSWDWMHCLASFKLCVFHKVVRMFHFCCYSLNLWRPYVCPNAGERPVVPRKAGAPHSDPQNCSKSLQQTCAKCIHLFLSLLMIYLQQSRKNMSKPYMCLFVCWGSFSESHLLECECNSTPYTGSSRKLSRLVTWLRIPRTTPVPLDVISHSGQAKRLWQKWVCNKRRWWQNTALTSYFDPLFLGGVEVGDFCCKHWHMCLSFVNSKLTRFEIAKCRTSLFMLLSWTMSKRGSEAFVWSWNWKDLLTIRIYMWHWMYDVTDVWSSMLQLATACLLDTY